MAWGGGPITVDIMINYVIPSHVLTVTCTMPSAIIEDKVELLLGF